MNWAPAFTGPVAIPEALEQADRLNIYAYDAYFLECARKSGAPLASLDRELAGKARESGLPLLEI